MNHRNTLAIVALFTMAFALPLTLIGVSGCSGFEEVDPSALCDDALQAIAQRTLTCTNDITRANARFDAVKSQAVCKSTTPVTASTGDPRYQCIQTIQNQTCAQVEAHGDDLKAWLTDPMCPQLFDTSGADGGVGDAGDGGNP